MGQVFNPHGGLDIDMERTVQPGSTVPVLANSAALSGVEISVGLQSYSYPDDHEQFRGLD